jgi:hypothetical protein
MTPTTTPSTTTVPAGVPAGRDGFGRLLRAEWTKLTTVRGWVLGLVAAAVVMVLLALPTGAGDNSSCGDGPQCAAPVGPDGDEVSDTFYFVRQPLTGDGTITVRVTSLTGVVPTDGATSPEDMVDGVEPWAKAGLMIRESTDQGSPYAAVMATGSHGVRLQHNYEHDVAGSTARVSEDEPQWLRLTREGDVVTGYESSDGTGWTEVGSVRLDGLPSTVQVGLFTASPQHVEFDQQLLGFDEEGGPTRATGVFDELTVDGTWSPGTSTTGAWSGDQVGDDPVLAQLSGFDQTGDTFSVSASGDIAPMVQGAERTIERSLVGTFAGLIVVTVIAVMFITAEYRRGLIHTTFAASPRRGRVLAAKAVVIGATTFVVGLVAAFLAVQLGERNMRANGLPVGQADAFTELRIIAGTAALLAVAAVLALAIGTVLRRSAAAVAAVIVAIVLPYILATASILPQGPSEWLLRLTPAAAFSVQQSLVEHPQVTAFYAPANGYFPLAPWAGFAVLCAYTAGALALAATLLRRRDA